MNQHEAFWPLKKCMLYILCTLILSNPLCLIIGSSLTLIQNVIIHILFFYLCFGFPKDAIKISTYCTFIIFLIYHIFVLKVVKSGSLVCVFTLTHDVVEHTCAKMQWVIHVNVCLFLLNLEWWLKSSNHPNLVTKKFQSNCDINGRSQSTIDQTNQNLFRSLQTK